MTCEEPTGRTVPGPPPERGHRTGRGRRETMKAVVWNGVRDVRTETVPDPRVEEPDDAVIRLTSSGLCGSDLHLYEVLGPFMNPGDILGHEPMGVVDGVGSAVSSLNPRARLVVRVQLSCAHWLMRETVLETQAVNAKEPELK